MKYLVLISFLILVQHIYSQDSIQCNYVESGYYQLIYEADIAWLEGNEDLAYEKYKEAEKRCPLLNQSSYREMGNYAALLMARKEFGKALHYMDKLAVEYGEFPFFAYIVADTDSLLMAELLMAYPAFNDSIAPGIMKKSEDFYTSERISLVEKLTALSEKDQQVRELFYSDKKDESYLREEELRKINEVDVECAKELLAIIDEYGLPSIKMYGIDNMLLDNKIGAIFVHNADNEELERIAWKHVQSGEFSPYHYGFMLDKKQELIMPEKVHAIWLYWVYDNITDESRIIDVEHVDNRRMAIGMPTRDMHKKRQELFRAKYERNSKE